MYAAVCSADVRGGGTIGRTLCKLYKQTYALQTVQADVRGTIGRMLLFEYPLGNT
jgi:hypothetical protein